MKSNIGGSDSIEAVINIGRIDKFFMLSMVELQWNYWMENATRFEALGDK
jgi:hypothetical protein